MKIVSKPKKIAYLPVKQGFMQTGIGITQEYTRDNFHVNLQKIGKKTDITWNSNEKFDRFSVTMEAKLGISHGAVRNEGSGSDLVAERVTVHSHNTAWSLRVLNRG